MFKTMASSIVDKSTDNGKPSLNFFTTIFTHYRKAENAPKTTNKFERKTDSGVHWFHA